MKRTLALLLICAAAMMAADTRFILPVLGKTPVIDGKIEGTECLTVHGFVKHNSLFLSARQGTLHFALTPDSFYFAATSQLPPDDVKLLDRVKKRNGGVFLDDNVELDLAPPGVEAVYQIIVNPSGTIFSTKYPIVNGGTTHTHHVEWLPNVTTASRCENGVWSMEMAIPLKELGNPVVKQGSVWGMLAGRNWQQPAEQTTLHNVLFFSAPDTMTKATVSSTEPVVSQMGIGAEAANGKYDLHLMVRNQVAKVHRVRIQGDAVSDAAPRQIDQVVEIPAQATVPLHFAFDHGSKVVTEFRVTVQDADNATVLFSRNFTHDPLMAARWDNPNLKKDAQLDFGFYPYYRKLRARFGSPEEPATGWQSAVFRVTDDKGALVAELPGQRTKWGFEAENNDFAPSDGEYRIAVVLQGENGTRKELNRKFVRRTFPWEHNSIATERVIVPPYCPLVAMGERGISCLLTSYSFRDGFFDAVTADGQSLLAAPITLSINGEILHETAFRFTEKAQDRACTETTLAWKGGTVLLKGMLDYDGFYRFTLAFRPNGRQEVRSAVLSLPLRREFATQLHSTCNKLKYNDAKILPTGTGILWRSSQSQKTPRLNGSFRPYVWLGTLAHGLAWCTQTDQGWSIPEKGDALEVVADENSATLRVNIVGKPTVWEAPFTLEQAIQATPVRPRPGFTRRFQERVVFPNAWTLCTFAGPACWGSSNCPTFQPADGDYSFVNYLAKRQFSKESNQAMVEQFMSHVAGFPEHRRKSFKNHLERGIAYSKISRWNVPYLNSRCSHLKFVDYLTFMDEWWCSEYRAENADEYNTTPTASFRDMAVYYLRSLLRAGMDGIYYDNVRDWTNPNPVTGPAYRLANGAIQPYFDIFEQRELLKRTAIMLHQEGKTLPDGRPLLIAHATNTNLIPYTAFAAIVLDLEAEYGSKDFQDRFSEGYLQTCTLGLQSGAIPEILVQITGNNKDYVTRTFLAVTLAYDLPFVMNCGGTTGTWNRTWRSLYEWGYSLPEVKVTPCYENPPVAVSCPQWRCNVLSKTGEALVIVSSFGDKAEGTLDLTRLGIQPTTLTDWESKQTVPLVNGKASISVPRHDFRIFQVK